MDAQIFRTLEFDKIRDMLAEQTACSLGRELALALAPQTDIEFVRRVQSETSEAKAILDAHGSMPLGGITDIRPVVQKAQLDAMLQPVELVDVAQTLAASRRLRSFLLKFKDSIGRDLKSLPNSQKFKEDHPGLVQIAGRMSTFEKIEEQITGCISPGGEVLDSASQTLANVRADYKTAHGRIMERLNTMLQSKKYQTALQEPVITQREGRYCIPVKVEYRSQVRGIVHDASSSGATIFVEPEQVIELGNDMRRLEAKEREEVEKVLKKLSLAVSLAAPAILETVEVVALIDFITAKARLSIAESASEPALNRDGWIRLMQARHPLLKGDVVPIDVELGRRYQTLLITGPNTGGKTVSLKTIGLLTLMAQAGLHVPAAPGSEIAVFDQVFADIGDEQSIEQSLSTFSSHIGKIVSLIKKIKPNALVLLDEIGAGTDPAEGAALATSILEFLLDKGARTVATTHYGELKEFAFVRDGIQNASVEFDLDTLRPTYNLMVGVPGSSNAFAIAGRLGMPGAIISHAEANLAGRTDGTDETIRRIEESHREALEDRRQAEKASSEAESLRKRYEEELRRLEKARARIEDEVRGRGKQLIDRYTRKLERSLNELAKVSQEGRRSERIEREAKDAIEKVREELVEIPEPVEEEIPVDGWTFKKGDSVRIANLNQEGVLATDVKDGEAVVVIGSMRVSVPQSSLRPGSGVKKEEKVAESGGARIALAKAAHVSPELKLIAQRAEGALHNLERYLDEAHAAGLVQVRIIHGKGTGALKNAVWQFLKDHPAVESYRLGEQAEGGSGATVVTLK